MPMQSNLPAYWADYGRSLRFYFQFEGLLLFLTLKFCL
ncbi:MAG: hypothetical protein OJF59_003171 [Cytophagales bacterium]|nr:MAG: hypothetical protein OJF59_003171 [Cytophagales bacterium]